VLCQYRRNLRVRVAQRADRGADRGHVPHARQLRVDHRPSSAARTMKDGHVAEGYPAPPTSRNITVGPYGPGAIQAATPHAIT